MKKILIIVLIFISGIAFSDANNLVNDSTVSFITYWQKGDRCRYIIEDCQQKYMADTLIQNVSFSTDVTLTVLDSTSNSYTIEWLNGETTLNTEQNVMLSSILKLTKGTKFNYKINELGEFIEITDWIDMRDKIKLKIDSLREELKDIPHLTRTFKKLESMYATKEQIEANAQSLQLLHSPFGVEFDLNDTIRTETLLPNPIGGEPLPAKYLVVLTEINQEEGYCVLEAEQILDKEKSRDFIIDFMMQVLPKKIDKDTIVRILDDFEIRDKTLYSMDLNTGWILNCDFTRTVKAGELFALQTINIEMKFEEENNTDGNTFNTRDAFVENFGNEILSAEDVYANLKSNGLKEYQKSVFDIHFESDSKAKLQNIREFLESIYGFTFQEEIVHDDIFEIRMTTDSIPVSKETLLFFTLDMAKRAYEFDCGFGAFGTEIDKSPNFPKLELGYVLEYYDKALEEYYKGNTSKAMIYWTLIIEIDSANEEIYYNRAIAKNELFLSKSALLDYDKALEINPNYTDALLNRASLRDEMEDYQGALTDLNKLIELEPENERAYFNRGNTYQHMDNLEAACSEWNKALELGMEEAQERIEEFCE